MVSVFTKHSKSVHCLYHCSFHEDAGSQRPPHPPTSRYYPFQLTRKPRLWGWILKASNWRSWDYKPQFYFQILYWVLSSSTSFTGFPGGSVGKESACNAGDPGSIPGWGRSPGEGNGYPLQYSCLENPMDRGAWWATVHGVLSRVACP